MTKEEFGFKLYNSKNIEFKLLFQLLKENLSILINFIFFIILFVFIIINIDIDFFSFQTIMIKNKITSFSLSLFLLIVDILTIFSTLFLIFVIVFFVLFPILTPTYSIFYNITYNLKVTNSNYFIQIVKSFSFFISYLITLIKFKNKKLIYFNPLYLLILPITMLDNPNLKIDEILELNIFRSQNKLGFIFMQFIKLLVLSMGWYILSYIILFPLFYIIGTPFFVMFLVYSAIAIGLLLFILLFFNFILQLFKIYCNNTQ